MDSFAWLAIASGTVTAVLSVRYLVMTSTKVNRTTAVYLTRGLLEGRWPTARLADEFVIDDEQPTSLWMLAWLPSVGPAVVSIEERLLQAGFSGKEVLCTLHHPRWAMGWIRAFLRGLEAERRQGQRVTVEAVTNWGMEPLGFLRDDTVLPPLHPESLWGNAERDVAACAAGECSRVGILLHGPPGTGKTSFVRYLAAKYRLPIKLFVLDHDMTNLDVLRRFSRLPERCVVLFEDFDSHFHGREPAPGRECKFSFDAILNGLDGVFGCGGGVVFALTTNRLDLVDPALKDRPGRFRHVLHFDACAETGLTADQTSNLYLTRSTNRQETEDVFTSEEASTA
jgi:hypothetical protein